MDLLLTRGVAAFAALIALAAPAVGQGEAVPPPEPGREEPSEPRGLRLFPEGVLYPPYVAEIRRPGFGATVLSVAEAAPEGVEDLRFGLKLGGRFGLVRWGPPATGRLWQLSLEAGFYGQFDIEHSQDNLGWDGLYGLVLTTAPADGGPAAYSLAIHHISSHVGDEIAERTGRLRIGYTREEVALGVSWRQPEGRGPGRWRLYGEGAWGYTLSAEGPAGEELQKPGRVEVGVEYDAPGVLGGRLGTPGRWGWFGALDVNVWEERDWQPSVSVQAGFLVPSGDRRWRLGVAAYDGQLPLGEFFQVDERYVLAGLWLDLERVR